MLDFTQPVTNSRAYSKGVCSRQGCVLAPLLFNMFFTAVLRVVEKPFAADTAITDSLVQLQRKQEKKKKKRGKARAGHADGQGNDKEAQTLWAMLYADDAGIASRTPHGLEMMMPVIVCACAAFGLTVSEAKTEIMCLQTKDRGDIHRHRNRPSLQSNYRVCVLGRDYQRRLDEQECRGNASTPECMDMLRAV